MDQRKERTRTKIKNALLERLAASPLSDITVTSVCDTANVNRSTFYAHYDNVMDCFNEIADEIVEEMRQSLYAEKNRTAEMYFRIYVRTAMKHRGVFKAIHSMDINNPMIEKMTVLFYESTHIDVFVPKNDENLAMSYFFSGFYGLIAAWLRGGCKATEDEIVQILRGSIYYAHLKF